MNPNMAYAGEIAKLLTSLDYAGIDRITDILRAARDDGRCVFVMGNGGSAATVNHFACDLGKNAVSADGRHFRIVSLSESASAITAYGNDTGFDNVFAGPLGNLMQDGDVVLAVSASGNSPDIVKAAQYAREKGTLIGLTGFSGGKLRELAHAGVHIASDSYELVEDLHSIISHMMVCALKAQGE